MILKHYDLENPIDFDESSVWTLVCESPRQFSKLTRDFCAPLENECGWMLYDGKMLDIAKYTVCLIDFHGASLNDKKSSGVLQDKLKKLAFDENHTVLTHEIISKITAYLNELTLDVDFPVKVSDVEFSTVLKSVTVSFLDESVNLHEKLLDYVTLLCRLTVTKLLVCVNLRCYLEYEQLVSFFAHCEQSEICLLCIESRIDKKITNEKILCSDKDMCEFYA